MPKKKKNETKPVEKQEPKEIKPAEIKTKDDGALLTLDGQKFFLKRNNILRLVNQHSPGTDSLRLSDFTPEDSYKDLNTIENTARLTVLMSRQKLAGTEAAKKMGIPYDRFIKWLNDNQAKLVRKNIMSAEKEKFLKAVEEYENKESPKEPRKKLRGFDPIKVGEAFVEGEGNIDFVIKKLKTTRQEFMFWYQLNLKAVTKYLNTTAQDRVINEFRDLIDKEEDDDRTIFVV